MEAARAQGAGGVREHLRQQARNPGQEGRQQYTQEKSLGTDDSGPGGAERHQEDATGADPGHDDAEQVDRAQSWSQVGRNIQQIQSESV